MVPATTAVRIHEISHNSRAGKYRLRACLLTRASLPQADTESRAVAERCNGHQHVNGDAAKDTFEK
jgi:hypothetical protein